MSLPSVLSDRLRLPAVASPMFIVSGPDLVIAQCDVGHRRLLPLPQRPPAARPARMAHPHHRSPRQARRQQPRDTVRAVRGQPDRPQEQRPPRRGPRDHRRVRGPDRHHVPRRPRRRQRRHPQLRRHRPPRRHQQHVREEGRGEGRRRPHRRRGRRRRTRGHPVAVRVDPGDPRMVRRAAPAVGLHRPRPLGPRRAGRRRRPRLRRLRVHRHRRGRRRPGLQADDRRLHRVRHRLLQPVHRGARQLPARQHRGRRTRPEQPRRVGPVRHELRCRRERGHDTKSEAKPWRDIWGAGQGIGAVDAVSRRRRSSTGSPREYAAAKNYLLAL